MWSPSEPQALGAWCRRLVLATTALLCLPLLAGCQFQPLYGTTPDGKSLKTVMKSVDISPIPGRVGQRLRNELIFGTTGGGNADAPKYKLQIAIRESITSILVETTGDAEGQLYNLSASFQLIRIGDSAVLLKGESTSRAAYDKFEQIFANTRARIDAENRAARIVADGIKTRIAAFLSGNA
jgi:LPS-assembly lipoprotein